MGSFKQSTASTSIKKQAESTIEIDKVHKFAKALISGKRSNIPVLTAKPYKLRTMNNSLPRMSPLRLNSEYDKNLDDITFVESVLSGKEMQLDSRIS